MKVVKVDVKDLKESKYNPRRISDKNFSGLKNSIKRFGLVKPLVVNKRNNVVIGGNQRLRALKELGIQKVNVCYVDLDENEEKALNLALNNKGIAGEFTEDVNELINKLKEERIDLFDELRLYDIETDVKKIKEKIEEKEIEKNKFPEMELQPYEHYDYVFIVVNDVRDWNWLATVLDLKRVNASPVGKTKVGLMRGLWFKDFKKKIEEYYKERFGKEK